MLMEVVGDATAVFPSFGVEHVRLSFAPCRVVDVPYKRTYGLGFPITRPSYKEVPNYVWRPGPYLVGEGRHLLMQGRAYNELRRRTPTLRSADAIITLG